MEDSSAFAAFQPDDSERTPEHRGRKRPLTEPQRKAKNERDRKYRQEHRVEFERLQNVGSQCDDLKTQLGMQTNTISELEEENQRLKNRESHLNKRIEELENALLERAAPNLLLQGNQLQPMVLIGGEINQMVWTRAHLPLMPDLCISAAVQTQVIAAIPAEGVIDKETITNQFTMNVPFLFVASKMEEVTCIRLRGKCSACPEGGLWIPHQTNQKSWENLGWSPVNVGSIQDLAPSGHTGSSCGAQAKFPIKFLLWNSVGTLDTYGQRVVMDLINRFRPAVLVIAETKLPRDRAEEIKDTFHFDAHHVPPNLEFVGGMWLLWRSDVVEVEVLSFTEQEIHARINEPQTNQRETFRGSHFKTSPTHSEEDAANNVHITQGPRSSQGGRMYTDELVQDFSRKLDAKDKSQVDFSDFSGLMEEVVKSGTVTLPPSLALTDKKIEKKYGEIAAESKQSSCTAMPSRILLCAAIKEMDELQLESIDEKKMLLWRDAINSALNINFKVDFAIEHLKKIGHAYFGLKARNDQELRSIEEKISTLQIELSDWEEKRAKKVEEQNSEVRKDCPRYAEYFQGKSLSAGLLH
ncbi:hypothetical protein QQP08_009600 [Theobroma cacao]|nr:hypothetical protein QQP08_009600 [Theobroma cacao]